LAAFDSIIQQAGLRTMQRSLKRFPFEALVACTVLTYLPFKLDLISSLASKYGMSDVKVWPLLVLYVTASFVHIPTSGWAMWWMMSKLMHLSGWKEWLWIVCGMLSSLMLAIALTSGLNRSLHDRAKTSNAFLLLGGALKDFCLT